MSTESTFLLVQCLQVSPLTPAWMARKMSSSSCTNCAISCRTLKKVAEKLAFEAYVGEKLAFCFRITLLPCTTSHCVMWCTRLYKTGWPLNLKWITFCWSRPGKCLPLDEGSACVWNGGILHNDYFDFIYDRLATREKKKTSMVDHPCWRVLMAQVYLKQLLSRLLWSFILGRCHPCHYSSCATGQFHFTNQREILLSTENTNPIYLPTL